MDSGDIGFTRSTKAPKGPQPVLDPYGNLESVVGEVVDCGFKLHDGLGPGLLESAYESFLAASLRERGLLVEQQRPVAVTYKGVTIKDAFKADLLIERLLIVEVKSVEKLGAVHAKQLLTYLRLTDSPLGLLMNFGAALFSDGVKRVINNRSSYKAPRQ